MTNTNDGVQGIGLPRDWYLDPDPGLRVTLEFTIDGWIQKRGMLVPAPKNEEEIEKVLEVIRETIKNYTPKSPEKSTL